MKPWEEQEHGPLPGDYYTVIAEIGRHGIWLSYVSTEEAHRIEEALTQMSPPLWLTFRTLQGERVCVRTSTVASITEQTAEQRARARAWIRALNAEEKAEKDWSTDE